MEIFFEGSSFQKRTFEVLFYSNYFFRKLFSHIFSRKIYFLIFFFWDNFLMGIRNLFKEKNFWLNIFLEKIKSAFITQGYFWNETRTRRLFFGIQGNDKKNSNKFTRTEFRKKILKFYLLQLLGINSHFLKRKENFCNFFINFEKIQSIWEISKSAKIIPKKNF